MIIILCFQYKPCQVSISELKTDLNIRRKTQVSSKTATRIYLLENVAYRNLKSKLCDS